MTSKLDIDHICRLAHLRLPEHERIKLREQMAGIIGWIDEWEQHGLEAGDEDVCVPDSPSLRMREDEIRSSLSKEEILSGAPDREKGLFKVPKVIVEK